MKGKDCMEEKEPIRETDPVAYFSVLVRALLDNQQDYSKRQDISEFILTLGENTIRASAQKSTLMQASASQYAGEFDSNSSVAQNINELQSLMKTLDPSGIDFKPRKFLGNIFNPAKAYFQKVEEMDKAVVQIMETLKRNQAILKNTNITLKIEQRGLIDLSKELEAETMMCEELVALLSREIEQGKISGKDSDILQFLTERILNVLQRKISDMRQMLIANHQAVLAMEIVINNNDSLMQNVEKIVNISLNMLQTTIYVARATFNQTLDLRKTSQMASMVSEKTGEFTKSIQGRDISVEILKTQFSDMIQTMDNFGNPPSMEQ